MPTHPRTKSLRRTGRGKDCDPAVTAFARMLIAEAEKGDGQKALAAAANLSESILSQVKRGRTGVGWGTATRLARARGQHLWEFIREAHEWHAQEKSARAPRRSRPLPTPPSPSPAAAEG